eukprot:UN19078
MFSTWWLPSLRLPTDLRLETNPYQIIRQKVTLRQ